MRVRTARLAAAASLTLVVLLPAAASAAIGCCVVLKPGKSNATSPNDVDACFPLQNLSDCDLYKSQVPKANVTTQWKGEPCSSVSVCSGRAPVSCCKVVKGGETTSCVPTDSDTSCTYYVSALKKAAQQSGGDRYAYSSKYVGGNACNLLTDCADKIEDPQLYGSDAGPSASLGAPAEIKPPPFAIPKLSYTVPGLAPFTAPGGSFKEGYLIPYIAQYIGGIYGWALGIVSVLAVSMIVWGGVKWQTAGGNAERASSAKNTIVNAVIGLLIAMSSYLILWTLNPALVEFKALKITTVQTVLYEHQEAVAGVTNPPSGEVQAALLAAAEKAGLPPCYAKVIAANESGGKLGVIGHDENFTRSDLLMPQARVDLLREGKKKSGGTFDIAEMFGKAMPGNCATDRPYCQKVAAEGPTNDDAFDLNAPPDYGLDWRYSHGVGLGQSTIFPNSKKCPGGERGFYAGNKCFTIPQLMTLGGVTEAMATHLATIYKKVGDNPGQVFLTYAGTSLPQGVNNPLVQKRVAEYNACTSASK